MNRAFRIAVFGIFYFLLVTLSSSAIAEYKDGVRAFNGQDYMTAITEFEKAAKAGNQDAILFLARIYQQGLGTPQDPKRAYELYKSVAEKGNTHGMISLGYFSLEGIAAPANKEEARYWYEKALDNGVKGAFLYCQLAKTYESGAGNSGNPEKVVQLLEKAAEETTFPGTDCANQAREKLVNLYANGIGVSRNSCISLKFRGEWLAYGGGIEWRRESLKPQNPDFQSIILSMIVAQYNRNMRTNSKSPLTNEDAFVKSVLSDYVGADRALLQAVLVKNGLGVRRDDGESARLADKAIAEIKGRGSWDDRYIKDWARSFYNTDLSCLQLAH